MVMTLTPPEFSSADGKIAPRQAKAGAVPSEPTPSFDVADALLGRNLGHFRVEARLGSGAMAVVYRATDLILERQVALKVLLPGADDIVRERFRQEARTVSVLDHPHIVRTLQVGQTDGVTYIAMDLIEGTSLADLLGERGRLSVADACQLLEPVARALAYAHRHHVVHRDVKPSNILLRRLPLDSPDGIQLSLLDYAVTPLLSDFGIALAIDSPELTAAGRTVGTPTYMAPEQAADSHEIDGRADIYALGIVLYRCLVGRPPFVGSTTQVLHAHVYEPLTIPDEIAAVLPPVVLETLQRMLAKEPSDRYADAAILADDLALASGAAPRSEAADQATATMPAISSPTTPISTEPVKVLIPGAGGRGTRSTTNVPSARTPTSSGVVNKTVTKPATPAKDEGQPLRMPTAPRRTPRRRNWVGLVLGSTTALLLIAIGVLLLRTLLPEDRFLGSNTEPTPAATQPIGGVGVEETGEQAPATPTPAAPTMAVVATQVQPASPSPEVSATPQPDSAETTPLPTPAPTLDVDVELFWDIVVEDFNRRDWNNALGNLILILRAESAPFNQALAQGSQSQATIIHELLLANPNAAVWAEWRPLFDQRRIEEMLFEIYVGLATAENANRAQKRALDHFDDALVLRPNEPEVLALRDATQQFLIADETGRESARRLLGMAHLQYANLLDSGDEVCASSEQLTAALDLLQNAELEPRLTELRQECDERQETLAGQRLLPDLTGAILYSTQEDNDYRIYRQPLEPLATPSVVVNDGREPRLAPDGRHLAYYSTRFNAQGVAVVDLTSGTITPDSSQQLTNVPGDARDSPPTWSFDGGRLAFASIRESDGKPRIYVKPAVADNEARSLASGQDPAWRPLGESWIAYSGRDPSGNAPGLWLISDDGSRWRQLTSVERDRRPTWSPDAQYIVFMSDGRDDNWELYRLSLSHDHQVVGYARLTNSPAQDGLPAISPDGKYVAFVSDKGGRWRIWVAPLDGSAKALPVAEIRGSLTNWLEHGIQWVAN